MEESLSCVPGWVGLDVGGGGGGSNYNSSSDGYSGGGWEVGVMVLIVLMTIIM